MPQLTIKAREVVRLKNVCGGDPVLNGTRIRVSDVVTESEHHGLSPEEITREFPTISIPDVYSALTYYYEHPHEIRNEIQKREKLLSEAHELKTRPIPA